MDDRLNEGNPSSEEGGDGYFQLLDEAREVSKRALARLRALRTQFPTAVPYELVEQVERLRIDPENERRGSPRLHDLATLTAVAHPSAPAEWTRAELVDRSANGLALRLDRPVVAGTVLLVWLGPVAPAEGWLPVEVKYCRADDTGWLAGCQVVRRLLCEQADTATLGT